MLESERTDYFERDFYFILFRDNHCGFIKVSCEFKYTRRKKVFLYIYIYISISMQSYFWIIVPFFLRLLQTFTTVLLSLFQFPSSNIFALQFS